MIKTIRTYSLSVISSLLLVCCANQKQLKFRKQSVQSDDLCFNQFELSEEDKRINLNDYETTSSEYYGKIFEDDSLSIYYCKYEKNYFSKKDRVFFIEKYFKNDFTVHRLLYDSLGRLKLDAFYLVEPYKPKFYGDTAAGSEFGKYSINQRGHKYGPYRKYDTTGTVIYENNLTPPEHFKICAKEALLIVKNELKGKKGYRNAEYYVFERSNLKVSWVPVVDSSKTISKVGWRVAVHPVMQYYGDYKRTYSEIEYYIDARTGEVLHRNYHTGHSKLEGIKRIYVIPEGGSLNRIKFLEHFVNWKFDVEE